MYALAIAFYSFPWLHWPFKLKQYQLELGFIYEWFRFVVSSQYTNGSDLLHCTINCQPLTCVPLKYRYCLKFIDVVIAGGMNGSVIYELDRPENKGLKSPFKACPLSLICVSVH